MESRPLHVRPAIVADLPAMIALERQCPLAAHWSEQQYQTLLSSDESSAKRLAIVIDGDAESKSQPSQPHAPDLLAFLIANHLGPEWELENIVVAPSARRKGLAARLLTDLFARARTAKSDSIFLEVRESNQPARALYEKNGFRQSGRRANYYTAPSEDALIYRLDLP